MARESYEIYQRWKPLKIALKVLISIIMFAVILAVIFFFWFQSYIVYTSDGIRLDVPFLDRGEVTDTIVSDKQSGE